MERLVSSAVKIQACFRGYLARKSIKRSHKVRCKWRVAIMKVVVVLRMAKQMRYINGIAKYNHAIDQKKRIIHHYETLYNQIDALAAAKIDSFVRSREDYAASKIQSSWQGFRARKIAQATFDNLRRYQAARIIQKWYRRRKKSTTFSEFLTGFYHNTALSDKQRNDLLKEIETFVPSSLDVSRPKLEEKQDQLEQELKSYLLRSFSLSQKLGSLNLNQIEVELSQEKLNVSEISESVEYPSYAVDLAGKIRHGQFMDFTEKPVWFQELFLSDYL